MRFSSLVSLVVVTASFALAGCAADAEPSSSPDDGVVKLDGDLDRSRTRDVRAVSQHSDEAPSPLADATRARNIETYRVFETLAPEEMVGVVDDHTAASAHKL